MATGILILLVVGCLFVGVAVGILLAEIFLIPRTFGTLHVDHTDPDNLRYLFEIDNLMEISNMHKVVLKVDPTILPPN
jgi:hypothetical protein